MTRGELLEQSISFALIGARKLVRGLWHGLTEQERQAVARAVVQRLREHGDKWELDEELDAPLGHSTPTSYPQRK